MAKNHKQPDKLAQDAAAAKAAGLSYGKWRALQTPTPVRSPQEPPPGWKRCAWCGTHFKLKTNKKQMYCQVYCQKSAQNERYKERKKGHRTKEEESQ